MVVLIYGAIITLCMHETQYSIFDLTDGLACVTSSILRKGLFFLLLLKGGGFYDPPAIVVTGIHKHHNTDFTHFDT